MTDTMFASLLVVAAASYMCFIHRAIALEIRRLAFRMRLPHAVQIHFIRKEFAMLVYSVTAGPVVDNDVMSRRLTVTVNGEQISEPVDFDSSATSLGEIKVEQDSSVVLTLVDIDDAGNASEPAVLEFVATDTIPPAKPGEFGVALVREV